LRSRSSFRNSTDAGAGVHGFRRPDLGHQPLQRRHGRPARQAVVAHIDDAARLQLALDELDDRPPRQAADPAVDAVQGDEVEFGNVGRQHLLEAGLEHREVVDLAGLRPAARRLHVGRIDVAGEELALRVGGRHHRDGLAVTAAELAIGEGLVERPRAIAVEDGDVVQVRRRQLGVEIVGVGQVMHIAFGPVELRLSRRHRYAPHPRRFHRR